MVNPIEDIFPGLSQSPYAITSAATRNYNCFAWAIGDVSQWWWPDPDLENDAAFWPNGVAREETLPAFRAALASLGFKPSPDDSIETGFEKVALFAQADGTPTHVARQLPHGRWTSKLGTLQDIEHDLFALCGGEYGKVVEFYRRPAA